MNVPLFVGYVVVFALSAVACALSFVRTPEVRGDDVRHGLRALLVTSGGWAVAHVGYLVAPSASLKYASYLGGLVVGFMAVGAWLYFCSAYTDRTYHRQRPYRYVAVAVFGGVLLLKLTNPVHSLYFTAELVDSPFPHLAVRHGTIHWLAMALAYTLSAIGFFMLFERFVSIGFDTRPLAVLAGVTALPVLFDVLGFASPTLLDMTYGPIGVAAFAVGVFFVYFQRFQAISLTGADDDPVLFLDETYRVSESNRRARELFPALEDAVGTPLSEVAPRLADRIDAEDAVIELSQGSDTRYYRVSTTPFTADGSNTGYFLSLSDVTETERYRRELERKTAKLEQFASVVSHDLRNPLSVAQGYTELARDDPENAETHLANVAESHERMETLISDLLTLARAGRAIEETAETPLSELVTRCWGGVETAGVELVIESDRTVVADPDRLQQLFENLFRNATEHGGSDVTVTVGTTDGGFYVADDGPGIPESDHDDIFAFGYSTETDGTGFGLSIVSEIVEGHGWEIAVVERDGCGARFEITNVEFAD